LGCLPSRCAAPRHRLRCPRGDRAAPKHSPVHAAAAAQRAAPLGRKPRPRAQKRC
jgi:hypothetical protein